jgi:hypothetical protein
MVEAYLTCIQTATPVVKRDDYRTENAYGRHERLILPWAIDGQVARLSCALDRFPAEC